MAFVCLCFMIRVVGFTDERVVMQDHNCLVIALTRMRRLTTKQSETEIGEYQTVTKGKLGFYINKKWNHQIEKK